MRRNAHRTRRKHRPLLNSLELKCNNTAYRPVITRSTTCGDRRGIQVTLTDKARQLLRDASGALAEAVTRAIKGLEGQHDCAMMHSLLPKSTDTEDNTVLGPSPGPRPSQSELSGA
ncbi:hypothetical protein ACFVW9_24560 [Streptomyces sp. NPDC058217]|uniref:hypothetical protein n=1 Tax=Streptomyces sp. NPDC058217 TaxID=3346384 RepID=UPI0036E72648